MSNRVRCSLCSVASSVLALLLAGIVSPEPGFGAAWVTNHYSVLNDDIANPERGFYLHTETRASSPSLVPGNLANLRVNGSRDPNGAYVARITLVLRVVYLDTFANAPISSNFLASIEADLNSIRNQGAKAVLRFAYFDRPNRPFPEPTKAQLLDHIGQLAPMLRRHRDVIALLQQGFIGAWGEGYYTDVFSTAGQLFTAQNWNDRAEVIRALLEALPAERMIQVRVPQQRQKLLSGAAAPISAPPSAALRAYDASPFARIGFHNDCFLADASDAGTFNDYSGGTDSAVIAALRAYQAEETKFTVMGGETCAENGPADDCGSAGGRADGDLALFHYSFLNQSYNANVNDDWVSQGCLEDIKRRLGYRLELLSGAYPNEVSAGGFMPIYLELRNVGYAAPFNPRGMEVVLRHANSGRRFYAELSRNVDARRWWPGANHRIDAWLRLPADLPGGSYEVFLHLPDPAPSLYGVVPYSIRLANANVTNDRGELLGSAWDPATGYHRLGPALSVVAAATNAPGLGLPIPVLTYSAVRETYSAWRARNFSVGAGDLDGDPDGDGWTNLAEYGLGTDPNAGASAPSLVTVEEGRLVLTIQRPPGVKDVSYEVEASPGLSPASWSADGLSVVTNGVGGLRFQRDASDSRGFLRLRVRLTTQD